MKKTAGATGASPLDFFTTFYRGFTQQDLVDSLKATNKFLTGKVADLQAKFNSCGEGEQALASKYSVLQKQNESNLALLVTANQEIQGLKFELANQGDFVVPRPAFLSTQGWVYLPRITIPCQDAPEVVTMEDPREIYTIAQSLRLWAAPHANKTKIEKLKLAWAFAITCATYSGENGDNWQPAFITLLRRKGDCECTSIVFVAACRVLGLRADEVFLAVGPTSFGYHAYPIVFLSQADVNVYGINALEGWFIFESTLDQDNTAILPVPIKGSIYWVNGGLQNWQHYGAINQSNLSDFNGAAPQGFVGADMKVQDDKEKRRQLKKYLEMRQSELRV